jgi:hypothetical protein
MKPEQLQLVWQTQPRTEADVALVPVKASRPTRDFAVPTAQFTARPPSVRLEPRQVGLGVAAVLVPLVAAGYYFIGSYRAAQLRAEVTAAEGAMLLRQCREALSSELGTPNLPRADSVCRDAATHDVPGAVALVARVDELRQCESWLAEAETALQRHRDDEPMRSLIKLHVDCDVYFARAQPLADALFREARESARARCAREGGEACEWYVNLSCQRELVEQDELAGQWLAKRAATGRPPWECPRWRVLDKPAVPEAGKDGRTWLIHRAMAPQLNDAAVLLYDGDLEQARALLQRVLDDPSQSALQNDARAMLLDVELLSTQLRSALAALKRDELATAAHEFELLLRTDERLMLGPVNDRELRGDYRRRTLSIVESFFRREAITRISRGSFERGRALADAGDFRKACVAWKVGASFSRGDLDLLKALTNVCTKKAASALAVALTCAQLDAVLDFAVDGDGYKEVVLERKRKEGCPE